MVYPGRAEIILGFIEIYLHFQSFLNTMILHYQILFPNRKTAIYPA